MKKKTVLYKTFVSIALISCAGYIDTTQAQPINMPKELHGDWFNLTDEGKKSCANYRKHQDSSQVTKEIFRIGKHDFKDYINQGDGKYLARYFVPRTVNAVHKNLWVLDSPVYIGVGEIGDTQKMSTEAIKYEYRVTFKLQNGLLSFADLDRKYGRQLFKCLVPTPLH